MVKMKEAVSIVSLNRKVR